MSYERDRIEAGRRVYELAKREAEELEGGSIGEVLHMAVSHWEAESIATGLLREDDRRITELTRAFADLAALIEFRKSRTSN